MSDFIDYIEKHPVFFGGLATIAAAVGVPIVGWIIPFLRRQKQISEEKVIAQNEEKVIAQVVEKP